RRVELEPGDARSKLARILEPPERECERAARVGPFGHRFRQAPHLDEPAVGGGDAPLPVDDDDPVAGRLERRAQEGALPLELALDLMAGRHVDHDSAQTPAAAAVVDEARALAHPYDAPVDREQAVLQLVLELQPERCDAVALDPAAVVGVEMPEPEVGVLRPRSGRIPEQALGVSADEAERARRRVGLPDARVDVADEVPE